MIEIRGETHEPQLHARRFGRALIGKTIGDCWIDIAVEFAANEALVSVFENQRFTYAAFLDQVNRCARSLMALAFRRAIALPCLSDQTKHGCKRLLVCVRDR